MPKQTRIPGHPGPTQEAIERRQRITQKLDKLHQILGPILDTLPNGSSLTITNNIRGDRFTITISPADTEEEPK